jgi:hypothetical protein
MIGGARQRPLRSRQNRPASEWVTSQPAAGSLMTRP